MQAVREVGAEVGIGVIPGMEVTSAEEIHLLALFEDVEKLEVFAGLVREHLSGRNDPDLFGDQIIVDEEGTPVVLEEYLLIGATDLAVGQIVDGIHKLDGLLVYMGGDCQAFQFVNPVHDSPDRQICGTYQKVFLQGDWSPVFIHDYLVPEQIRIVALR